MIVIGDGVIAARDVFVKILDHGLRVEQTRVGNRRHRQIFQERDRGGIDLAWRQNIAGNTIPVSIENGNALVELIGGIGGVEERRKIAGAFGGRRNERAAGVAEIAELSALIAEEE